MNFSLSGVNSFFVSSEDTYSATSGLYDAFYATNRTDVTVEELGADNHRPHHAFCDDEDNSEGRVAEQKTKDDEAQQMNRPSIAILKPREMGGSDNALAPVDLKEIGTDEDRASPRTEDEMKCCHTAMVQTEGV